MKYPLLFIALMVLAADLTGQVVRTEPSSFTALDPVKIIIDVSGTDLAGEENLFVWGWSPGVKDWPTNGVWENSNDAAALTMEGEDLWSFSLPITFEGETYNNFAELLAVQPGAISQIGLLAKKRNGNDGQTSDVILDVESLVFTPEQLRSFPSRVRATDVVALYLDTNAPDLTQPALKGLRTATLYVEDPTDETVLTFNAEEVQPGIWTASIYPIGLFGDDIEEVRYWFADPANPDLTSDQRNLQFVGN